MGGSGQGMQGGDFQQGVYGDKVSVRGYFRVGRVERRQRRGARRPPGRGGDKGGRRMALVTDGGGGQGGVSQAGSSGGRGDREVQ